MLKESLKESNTVIISDAVNTYFHGQNDYQDLICGETMTMKTLR